MEKMCPFRGVHCIRDKCAWWVRLKDDKGNDTEHGDCVMICIPERLEDIMARLV